ncbi:1388_t:CDS:2, partial [Acaulospora colombiana]
MFKKAQCLIIRNKPNPHYSVQTKLLQQRQYAASSKGKGSRTKMEPAPAPPDGQLPSLDKWKETFWHQSMKPILHNLVTGRKLVEAFGIYDAKVPKVIIEAFAGPGVLSRALCELPPSKMSKLIILENNPMYLPYLETLAALDKRVVLRPYDGWSWDSYNKISNEGLLDDIEPENWNNTIRDSLSAELALDSKALETYPAHFFPPHKHGKDFMVAANFRPLGYQ